MKFWIQVTAAKSIGKSIVDNFCQMFAKVAIGIIDTFIRKYRYHIGDNFASTVNKPAVPDYTAWWQWWDSGRKWKRFLHSVGLSGSWTYINMYCKCLSDVVATMTVVECAADSPMGFSSCLSPRCIKYLRIKNHRTEKQVTCCNWGRYWRNCQCEL